MNIEEMREKIKGEIFQIKHFHIAKCKLCKKEIYFLDKKIEVCEDCFNKLQEHNYINKPEKFWKHSYRVHLHELDPTGLLINADNDQDALDYAIDFAEEKGWEGLFFTSEELEQMKEEERDQYLSGGNHGRVLNSMNVRIIKID
jgi:predicted amidophosphoribosyltransferase